MEEKNFSSLMAILRVLEKEDMAGSSIEACINHLVESFDGELSGEQKTSINVEFARYYKRRSVPDTPIRDTGGDY
ncbi:MAG: hypothetical protein HYT72_04605 [Candidatus Aenigmarchaeota archaeon]|nr:hypothetical protein [Candidatus Aenigmarchaeota archaeon]